MPSKPLKLRVAIITSNYWPEKTGIGQVTTEFAEYLASNGIPVSVATALPYYPEWRISDEYRGRFWLSEDRKGVVILRAAHYAAPNPSTLGRIWHEVTLCVLSTPNMIKALRGSVAAFVVSPDLSHAFVGCLFARAMKVPIILIVQDVMPDAAVEMGMLTNKSAIRVARWLANKIYSYADRILTLSDGMKSRIGRDPGLQDKISIVPNTVDQEELRHAPDLGMPFRERFVPSGTISVVHTGNMGEKQDLFLLLRAARCLPQDSRIHFYVFGDGAVKESFLRLRDLWSLKNLSHFPLQERAFLPHMLYGADMCIVCQASQVIDVVVPSKLVSAMGVGAMIIAACPADSETAKVLRASGGGIIVPPSDEKALVRAIQDVALGRIDVRQHRQSVREYALRHFSRESAYGPLVAQLKHKHHPRRSEQEQNR
jgi:colanic acid biosynthesis glycosyl transferase WcaI